MRYYTRTGDAGETSLYTGERVAKDSARIEALGAMDELQAHIGLARAYVADVDAEIAGELEAVEVKLVDVMAELASVGGAARVTAADVSALEATIDKYTDRNRFEPVVPGTSVASASLHVARTVARRCERRIITLADARPELLQYANRLSDLLFALAVHLDL